MGGNGTAQQVSHPRTMPHASGRGIRPHSDNHQHTPHSHAAAGRGSVAPPHCTPFYSLVALRRLDQGDGAIAREGGTQGRNQNNSDGLHGGKMVVCDTRNKRRLRRHPSTACCYVFRFVPTVHTSQVRLTPATDAGYRPAVPMANHASAPDKTKTKVYRVTYSSHSSDSPHSSHSSSGK